MTDARRILSNGIAQNIVDRNEEMGDVETAAFAVGLGFKPEDFMPRPRNVTNITNNYPAPSSKPEEPKGMSGLLKGGLIAAGLAATGLSGAGGLALLQHFLKPAVVEQRPDTPKPIYEPKEFDVTIEMKEGKLVPTEVKPVEKQE